MKADSVRLTIDGVHRHALAALKVLTAKCDELGIPWFVSDGTLLGAVRHSGFIPWDDDVDLFIPEGDAYDALMGRHADFKYPYFLANEHTVPGWLKTGLRHGVFYDMSTCGVCRRGVLRGVFVDVFPFADCGNGMVWNKYLRTTRYPKEWWTEHEIHPFEDTTVRIPVRYDEILTKEYGDWRTPKQVRPAHGNITWYDIPYADYGPRNFD